MKLTSTNILATSVSIVMVFCGQFSPVQAETPNIKRVLLLSVDGLHSIDLVNCVQSNTCPNLKLLANTGINYVNAFTSKPSDSFPGLLAPVTGGTPLSTGVFYDDSYDRLLYPPGSTCTGTSGTEVVYDGSIDVEPYVNSPTNAIDPSKLPRDNSQSLCAPVFPHSFLRVNTIFEVIKATGQRTAWSDKHLAYDLVNGPSGAGVMDLYTPEIDNTLNNDGTNFCPSPLPTGITGSVACTERYDSLKVQAILNQINGKDSSGLNTVGVPAIFGMNFQAVSVGQKLPTSYLETAPNTFTTDRKSVV